MPLFGRKSKTPANQHTIEQDTNQLDAASMSAQSNSSCHVQSSSERQREGPGGRSQGDSNTPQIQKQRDNEGAISGGVGSAALRGLGLQREREAQEIYAQSQEIAEAESLEEEAREHRERAVAAGAHPAYRELGGGIKE